MKNSIVKFVAVLLCFSFFSCKKNITEASFYYWKTKTSLSQTEEAVLSDLNTKILYVRFFDVDISKETRTSRPVAVIEKIDSFPKNLLLIPVVFITNRTFIGLDKDEVIELSKHVFAKINNIKNDYSELQFDCDWSGKTKENYFLFLSEIKKLAAEKVKISCTIRLHQVKYALKTGIPPVDRGTLMFYNMGDLNDQNESNSIYNPNNAKKYTDFIKDYKLPLDAALPVFKWYVHYRNNGVIGLITKSQMPIINDTIHFSQQENNTKFNVRTDHLENGIFYKKDDVLKCEAINKEELLDAAELLKQSLRPDDRRLIFYDLDEKNINFYDKETFKRIVAIFN